MQRVLDHLFVLMQQLLPQHWLSRGMHRVARSRLPILRDALIGYFTRRFGIDLSEAAVTDPRRYDTFNEFFTRALAPGARPISTERDAVLSPVDGRVYTLGAARDDILVQAKNREFTLYELLGADSELAQRFCNGSFATMYLAPGDYHRVHMPFTGSLSKVLYVPGKLFSVNIATTRLVPRLFARNERIVCVFETVAGAMAVVLVGALFVGSIETVWAGEITPASKGAPRTWQYGPQGVRAVKLRRGEELGRFNMGSTVILLFEKGRVAWNEALEADQKLRMGETIGRLTNTG